MQQQLTPAANNAIQGLAQRYGVSVDAVTTLLFAVSAGGGSMAQFYHPELGGGGQWMRGGMTMVGDMFNRGLQATVAGLCSDLSTLLGSEQVFAPLPLSLPSSSSSAFGSGPGSLHNSWWPAELGNPSASGGQNDARYAVFPQGRRLAIQSNGRVTIYDTLDHQIGGVQQQQGGSYGSLSFTSQFGTFTVDSLPVVGPATSQAADPPPGFQNQAPMAWQTPPVSPPSQPREAYSLSSGGGGGGRQAGNQSHDEILATLERLSDLHQKGILSEDEFRSKKAELLSRL